MKLQAEFTLSYWDGPLEFFGTLDGTFVYCEWVEGTELADIREFRYWVISQRGVNTGWLGEILSRPESGRFKSTDVEWAV